MPHEPGHNEYKIIDTGQSYSGKVVKIGEYFYTSVSGVLEGTSRRVELSDGQSSNQDAEDMIQNQTITSKEIDMEGYVYNIRIENISDSTINLRFVEGQKIVDDPVLGGSFTR